MEVDAAARVEAMNYKLRKEAFVSNLSGSSIPDINLVTLVAASAILLWTALSKQGLLIGAPSILAYAIDFLLNVCAILFAFTVYSSVPLFLNVALIVPALILFLPLQSTARTGRKATKQHDGTANSEKRKEQNLALVPGTLIVRPFLTNYRGAMLIATSIAILAVDFHVFPRRFAKVETWGTSLMDLGVGSFVFSAGVVSARPVIRQRQEGQRSRNAGVVARMMVACQHSVPLFVLGLVRLVSVKNLDYAEHVTEYGVHWNFFFTLGLLAPFVEAVDSCLAILKPSNVADTQPQHRSLRYDVVALLISLSYEFILDNSHLLSFILIAPRTPESSLLVKNREGIFSFIGYLAIFLGGRSTGILTCQFQLIEGPSAKTKKNSSGVELEVNAVAAERKKVILPELGLRAVVAASLYFVSASVLAVNLTVSRRLANLPYVLWIIAFNNAQLLLFAAVETFGPKFVMSKPACDTVGSFGGTVLKVQDAASPVMQAFNRNGLVIFLVANLGTGLVNLTLNTLEMSNAGAMGILLLYSGGLTATAVSLHKMGVNIRI